LRFEIGGGRRIAAVTRCRESRLDLLNRQFRLLVLQVHKRAAGQIL
jgi:hypothetical protein